MLLPTSSFHGVKRWRWFHPYNKHKQKGVVMQPITVPRTTRWRVGSLLSAETHKSALARDGYTQRIVHLMPARESIMYARQFGIKCDHWHNLCRGSTRGCRAMCLTNSGRLGLSVSQRAAFVRSYLWQSHRSVFLERLDAEITAFERKCVDQPVIRLYGTHDGDILTDAPDVVAAHPDVIFNDYTKLPIATGWVADNVYRCKSATEHTTRDQFLDYAVAGLNHAVAMDVARDAPLPLFYEGIPVVDGDIDDLRFLDPAGVIVGLRVKEASTKAKRGRNHHGFIRDVAVTISA